MVEKVTLGGKYDAFEINDESVFPYHGSIISRFLKCLGFWGLMAGVHMCLSINPSRIVPTEAKST